MCAFLAPFVGLTISYVNVVHLMDVLVSPYKIIAVAYGRIAAPYRGIACGALNILVVPFKVSEILVFSDIEVPYGDLVEPCVNSRRSFFALQSSCSALRMSYCAIH